MILAWCDWRHGRQIGIGDAYEFEMLNEHDQLHVETLIDAQTARATADLARESEFARGGVERDRHQAAKDREGADHKIAVAEEHRAAEPEPGDSEGEPRRGPGVVGYTVALLVLYLTTLPADLEAAFWSPLPPAGQWLLAVMIGAGMVVAAHWAAEKTVDLHEAWRARSEDTFLYRESQIAVAAGLSLPVAAIISTAVWRSLGLEAWGV